MIYICSLGVAHPEDLEFLTYNDITKLAGDKIVERRKLMKLCNVQGMKKCNANFVLEIWPYPRTHSGSLLLVVSPPALVLSHFREHKL